MEKLVPKNFKEIGLAIMHQHAQCADGRQANELVKGLRKLLKELEAGLLRGIDSFRPSCIQIEELRNMQMLDRERRYVDLYLYAKGLPADGVKNRAAMGELNKRLLEMIDTTSSGLKKMRSEIAAAAQHRPMLDAHNESEVLMFQGEYFACEEDVIPTLHSVNMSKFNAVYINVSVAIGDRVASELASHLQTHPMSAVYLRGNNISDAGAETLAKAAFCSKSLSAFCITGNEISDTGARAVAEAVRNCHSLTTLYIYDSKISDPGAKAVAEAVKGCPLSVFFLGSSRISDSGAIFVAETVKGCPLSVFCLESYVISDAGAIDVAETMKDCPLSTFYLGGGKISDDGAKIVAEILSNGRCVNTLSAFCLWGKISDLGAKNVADTVRGCPLLSRFYLGGSSISGEAVTYILKGMAGIGTIRSVSLRIGEISKEQLNSCLSSAQESGIAKQLKLRFRCDTAAAKSVCEKFPAERKAGFAEFKVVPEISGCFIEDLILRTPKKF